MEDFLGLMLWLLLSVVLLCFLSSAFVSLNPLLLIDNEDYQVLDVFENENISEFYVRYYSIKENKYYQHSILYGDYLKLKEWWCVDEHK